MENPNPIPDYSSEKYTFDVLWCKAEGKWESFYFCVMDAITKKVVYDDMYSEETSVNLNKFFKEITPHLPEKKIHHCRFR